MGDPLPVYNPHGESEDDGVTDDVSYQDTDTQAGNYYETRPDSEEALTQYPVTQQTQGGLYDFQSVPVIFTAFAAAFLGSLIAPLLSDGVTRMLNVDEVQLAGLLPGNTKR